MSVKKKTIFGATMLVSGCCIGAGMIGLPVTSSHAGFIPSVAAMLFCYLFTTVTGLLIVEATLWFEGRVNLPSIVEFALGKAGKMLAMGLFVFLFYCLFVAYLDAGGSMFADIFSSFLPFHIPHTIGVLACMTFIATIAYAGTHIVDGFNRTMLIGMIASYFILVTVGLPSVDKNNLLYNDWSSAFSVVPILLICFGYQNLVPSLTYYLNKDVRALRIAIVIGNFIPFIVYFLWDYVILGMLTGGQATAGSDDQMVVGLLQGAAISSLSVLFFIKSFSIFAMLTSFLPNAMSFVDFLHDGLKISKHKDKLIYLLVFIPPTLCALNYPKIFLNALSFAGGFIDILLFGALPATVVLIGRRLRSNTDDYQVMGGNVTPLVILVLSLCVLTFKLKGGLF